MRIVWDEQDARVYRRGVDRVVIYPHNNGSYKSGIPLSGVTDISITPANEVSTLYTNDYKAKEMPTYDEIDGSITMYHMPHALLSLIGQDTSGPVTLHQQGYESFGMCYRTLIGDAGNYLLDVVFVCIPTSYKHDHTTVSDQIEPGSFTLDFTCLPKDYDPDTLVPFYAMTLYSFELGPEVMKNIEDILYGTEDTDPRFLEVDDVFDAIKRARAQTAGYPDPGLYPHNDLYPGISFGIVGSAVVDSGIVG